jgi:hypothetical protein
LFVTDIGTGTIAVARAESVVGEWHWERNLPHCTCKSH